MSSFLFLILPVISAVILVVDTTSSWFICFIRHLFTPSCNSTFWCFFHEWILHYTDLPILSLVSLHFSLILSISIGVCAAFWEEPPVGSSSQLIHSSDLLVLPIYSGGVLFCFVFDDQNLNFQILVFFHNCLVGAVCTPHTPSP